jgi:hypothetical protein
LFVFDKFTKKSFPANISDVAAERYFYDIPPEFVTGNVKPQITEELLSDIETLYSIVIQEIFDAIERKGSITTNQKEAMSYFLTVQILRTETTRNMLRVVLNESIAKLEQSELMFNPANHYRIMQKLKNHIWIMGINMTGQPFYTSDNPIVRRAHKTHPSRSYTGFGSQGIEVVFPLSSQCIIVMFEKTFFKHLVDLDRKSVPIFTENDVRDYNGLQVLQSHRQIYCMTDEFILAEQICEDHL